MRRNVHSRAGLLDLAEECERRRRLQGAQVRDRFATQLPILFAIVIVQLLYIRRVETR